MNMNELFAQLQQAGRKLAEQGQDLAEAGLGVPDHGTEREAMLTGLGKGALLTGALGLLLGTKTGRRLTGTAVKLGGLAALGGFAYKAYQNWQTTEPGAPAQDPGTPIDQLAGSAADARARALLRAMLSAARADGEIDSQEQEQLRQAIEQLELDAETARVLIAETSSPLDPTSIAAGADTPETAAEIYLASRLVIDPDNQRELTYLNELARALGLDSGLVEQLERQAGV